ncbi:MAG: aldehyde dehydrogenase family protein [Pseudomonadota bacterium]|nr:aldehyde dehydrogenase family protein [Pseudomonadota bacterium]
MADLGETPLTLRDPRTGAVVGEMQVTPTADVEGAVARARAAGVVWASKPLEERKGAIRRLADVFLSRAAEIADTLVAEIGKPPGEAWTSEIVTAQELFDAWLEVIDDELADIPVPLNPINYPAKDVVLRLEPVGVVGLIMPWNYPIHLPLRTIVPAVLAGNAVVWKPSEYAARCGALLDSIFKAAFPADLVITLQGGPAQGAALVDGGVDRVVFTGSVAGGRAVAQRAAARLLPTSLELGSKDPAIVLHDANLDRAVNGIVWGAFHNAGQDCASVERVYVDARIYDTFVEKVVAATQALRTGSDVGPLINEAALQKVHGHVTAAVAAGATVRVGGAPTGEGYFYPATVLTGVTDDMAVMREETFGPLLPIASFTSEDEAVARANASPYGLTASVWSKDIRRAEALAARVTTGVSFVNNCCFTGPMGGAAWGGRKESGYGVTGSRFGLEALVQPRTVCVDRSRGAKEMWWYPYGDNLVSMARGLVELTRPGGARLSGARMAVGGLLNRWK